MVLPFYREWWRRYIRYLREQFETARSVKEIDEGYDRFAFEREFSAPPTSLRSRTPPSVRHWRSFVPCLRRSIAILQIQR